MWANNCPAGLLKNKKLDIFVPGFARHFLFRAGKQCELAANFYGGGIGHMPTAPTPSSNHGTASSSTASPTASEPE